LSTTPQFIGRQRAVDISPAFGGRCIDVHAAEDDLERPPATDQPWQPLRSAATGDDPHCDLRLAKDSLAQRGVAHVEGHRPLAAAAAGDALDDGDGGLR
jgi:hypothetical protein